MKVWFRLLSPKLKTGEFEPAVMHICQTVKDFYPGTNVVALILETVELQRQDKKLMALRDRNEAKKKEDERQKFLLEAEYKKDPDKFVSSRKVQQLVANIGEKM